MKKRVLGLFMALMLGVTSMPTTAFAAEADAVSSISTVETVNNESKGETEDKTGEAETEDKSGEAKAEGETGENGTEGKSGEAKAEGETGENGTEGKSGEAKAEGETGENGTEGKSGEAKAEDKTGETETGDKSDETNAEGENGEESTLTVQAVQDMVDALPGVDAFSEMNEDELNAAYMAVQAAYDAYEGLTAEEQAQITGADCFEALFGWFNEQIAPLDDGKQDCSYGYFNDTTGDWRSKTANCDIVTADTRTIAGWWIVQGNVTINGDLHMGSAADGAGYLILADGATLTVNGSVYVDVNGCRIYAASENYENWGSLIIKADGDKAALTGNEGGSGLSIFSGRLEAYSASGKGSVNVGLSNNMGYIKATADNNKLAYEEWVGNLGLSFTNLVLEYCDHCHEDDEDESYFQYVSDGAGSHRKTCKRCGYSKNEDCEANAGYKPNGEAGHDRLCECGYVLGTSEHSMRTLPTEDGKKHISKCEVCGYAANGTGEADHVWDTTTGACTTCGFAPVAMDSEGNLYASVTKALDAVADGKAEYAKLYSPKGGEGTRITVSGISFDHPGKTVTLQMNGYILDGTGGPTLEVVGGTLIITEDAYICNTDTENVNNTIEVSGGELIFENNLTAEGGGEGATRKAAITATGGKLQFDSRLTLYGSLTITGSAELTKKLDCATGEFRSDGGETAARVSVVGSTVYKNVYELLKDGCGFKLYSIDPQQFVGGGDKTLMQDVEIGWHTHSYAGVEGEEYRECACGKTCSHEDGYHNDGTCAVCGKPCPHTNVDKSDYTCKGCGKQMCVKIQKQDGSLEYSTDFRAAMGNAEDGTTITLLADIIMEGWNKRAELSGDGKTVTLDLNGHKTSGVFIDVGGGDNYTSCTLKIIGDGNIEDRCVTVSVKATLDLSGWTGGTISTISISDNSAYDAKDKPGLIIGQNEGTIQKLQFGNNQLTEITNIELSGGSYNEIWVANFEPLQLGKLLAPGYAFQYADGTYEVYTRELYGGSIYDLTVVKCPHDQVVDGTCAYCNTTGIAATLDDVVYGDISEAVKAWLSNGGVLKLYKACNAAIDFSTATNKNLTIDLNGYDFNEDSKSMNLSGANLTIMDTTERGNGWFGGLIADSGTLILENGMLDLSVPEGSTATISLHGGRLNVGTGLISVPAYKMLEGGCYLKNGNLTVAPSHDEFTYGQCYTVGKTDITVTGDKVGEVELGKYLVPIDTTVEVNDGDVARVSFEWYVLNEDGTTALLVTSNADSRLINGEAAYDVKTDGSEYKDKGWKSLEKNKTYKLLCVVIGKAEDGAYRWQTVFQGYELKILPPDLKDATIEFPSNSNKVAFNPVGATTIKEAYVVKFGDTILKEGTDYTVVNNSDSANEVGKYTLTIQGVDSRYTGTKTADWEVVPHKLLRIAVYPGSKQYDGLADLPKDAITGEFMSAEGGYSSLIQLQEGKDYTLYAAYLTDINAGTEAKDFVVTVTLLNKNYEFMDGSTRDTFTQAKYPSTKITVEKALIPWFAGDTLTVMNNLAHSYTVDLSAVLQRALGPDSRMEYGDVIYGDITVDLGSYYNAAQGEARIENGKLILPIQAVDTETEKAIGKVTVNVSSTNILDFILTIDVSATNKFLPQLDGELTFSPAEITYGDTLDKITISGTMKYDGKVVPGKFTWQDAGYAPGVGTYPAIWIFTPDNDTIYESVNGEKSIKVNRATPTGAPGYTRITSAGKTLADAELSLTGGTLNPGKGTLEWIDENGNVLEDTTPVEANKIYKWRFLPDSNNYTTLTGGIELYHVEAPATPAPATPAPNPYYIMDGANSNWVLNEDGSMAIRGNGAFSKFTGVKVDGVLIDPSNYTVKEGSTIVTLKAEYLNTLSEGSHSFEILWVDGSAATDFTVTGNAADYITVNAPQTGLDSHVMFWLLLALAILSGLAADTFKRVKKQQ